VTAPAAPPRRLLEPGDVLAGRYVLDRELPAPGDSPAVVWRAVDDVLARPVTVKALPAAHPAAPALLKAAAGAGTPASRAAARVYDAATEPRHRRPSLAYVISEWVEGEPLPQVLEQGPLPPGQALDLAVQGAQALVALHGGGVVHGRIHPGNVLLARDGRLRLTDTALAAAVHGTDTGLPAGPGERARDVRDLLAVLYATATGRWPDAVTEQPARGLPAAPPSETGLPGPRQVRGGVPRALDEVVVRGLQPGPRDTPLLTAPALLEALRDAADAVGREERAVPVGPRPPGRLRTAAPLLAVAALLAAVGAVAFSLGLQVGEVPPLEEGLAEQPPPAAAGPGAPARTAVDLSEAVVRDFDPHGRPPEEKRDQVVNAYDGAGSTTWPTDLYRTERFGGLKPGVGLLVDLGAPTVLSEVAVDLTTPGTALEVRAGDALGRDETALPVVTADDGRRGVVRLAVPDGTRARYWLVWVTRLPADAGQFRAGIDELRLLRG